MRGDIEIADARVIGQRERDGRLLSPLAPPRFQNVREGAGAERVALERAGDGRGEFLRAVVVEQRQQASGRGAQGFAPGGEALQEGGHPRDGEPEAVARTRGPAANTGKAANELPIIIVNKAMPAQLAKTSKNKLSGAMTD